MNLTHQVWVVSSLCTDSPPLSSGEGGGVCTRARLSHEKFYVWPRPKEIYYDKI